MDALELIQELEVQRAENQTLRSELTTALAGLEEATVRIKQLEEQLAQQQALQTSLAQALQRLEEATARIKQLEGQAAKDSHTSSKPPSSNGFKEPMRKTASLRQKSGKPRGGQPGHRGNTLRMVERPDRVVRLSPQHCEHCQQELAQAGLCRTERVQVFDVPSLGLQVTE